MQQLEERSLKLLIDLLNESQIPDNIKQHEVHQKISELSQNPEFCNYIVYILTLQNDPALNTVRKIAGATLQGVLERNWGKIPSQTLNYVKVTLLKAIDDPNPSIRNTVTNVIAALFSKTGFKGWPELFKFLEMSLENQNQEVVESALGCISKIFEDIKLNSENMNLTTDDNSNPFHNIISRLMIMCRPDFPVSIRDVSLHSLNLFIAFLDSSLLGTYLEILIRYSEDVNPALRKRGCEGFHDTYEARKEFILHNLETVLDRVLKFTMDENREVKKAACRFWNEYLLTEKGESKDRVMRLQGYLDILVPVLIDCLHHSSDDLINKQTSQKDRLHQNYREAYNDEEEVSDEEEGNQAGGWTLRKEAARALDFLARYFKENIFSFAQEKIAACLRDSNWVAKEAGMLCLGALSKGALKAILPHLNDLVPFLMESLSDKEPLVRCTSCWALSKFTGWIADQGRANTEILKAYLIEILKRLMDNDPQVQESACTALSRLAVEDGQLIEPFLNDIIQVFKNVSEQYQKKSLANLFDTMASLASNTAHNKVQDPTVESTLMEIIIKQWNSSQFCDIESIYLVECTWIILGALEDNAAKYVEFFLSKSLILIFNYIQARKTDDKKSVYHKKEVALRSFEVFSVFIKVLKLESERFINPFDYQKLFSECAEDPDIVVRQFVLSSVGEVAKHCPNLLMGYIDPIAQVLMGNLVLDTPEADPYDDLQASCNNTSWSVGEVAIAFPSDFAKYAHSFAVRLCEIVESGLASQPRLKINLQLALGRLSLVDPDAVAQLLDRFLQQFCTTLNHFPGNIQKQQAFRGLFLAIAKNPNAMVKDFPYLCEALINFEDADADLQELAQKLIVNFKMIAGNVWFSYFENFPKDLQQKMRQKFGV